MLFVGFVVIQVAGLYVATLYLARSHPCVSAQSVAQSLLRIIRLTNVIPPATLRKHVRWLAHHGIRRVYLVKAPPTGAAIIQDVRGKALHHFAKQHFYDFYATYQLKNGQWLVLRGGGQRHAALLAGFIISEIVLLCIVLAFCVWIVQRLALPVGAFAAAARRFGRDVQAPPMALQGAEDRREVIQAFNEMQERIRRLITDRTQMLAAISHDLRTPITRLQLRIESLKGTPHYEKALADLTEMDRMIASILAFAGNDSRTEPMERFDLVALIENLCNASEDAGLPVSFDTALSRLPYFGRMMALKRVFSNLIDNAVKYGECAAVGLSADDKHITVTICDRGPGIPADEMEKVFTPFYRLDPARSPEKSGTGLGLATARNSIRAQGGDITLHNQESGGLQVVVILSKS